MDLTQHSKEYIRMISVLGNRPLSFNRFWAMAAMGVAWCLGGAMPALLKGFVGQKLILLFMIETPVEAFIIEGPFIRNVYRQVLMYSR